jgi:hypothetical protein
MAWGIIGLPYKLQFVPILDAHTGFPCPQLDQNWNYVGYGIRLDDFLPLRASM